MDTLTNTLPQLDLSGVDLGTVFAQVIALVPTLLPVIIGFIGFRKALSFVLGSLRGA